MKITLPDAPAIAGLTFRTFSGEADFPILTELLKQDMTADHTTIVFSLDEITHTYTPGASYDPYSQLVIAEVDDYDPDFSAPMGAEKSGKKAVAFANVFGAPQSDGSTIYMTEGAILPTWRRQGLGRALIRYTEQLARRWASQQQAPKPPLMQAAAFDTAVGAVTMLKGEGYLPVRHFYQMMRPHLEEIPEAPLPPGIEVRAVQPEHYRLIWEAHQEAFQDSWGKSAPTADAYERWLAEPDFVPSLWRVAWAGDQVVGQVRSFIIADENEAMGRLRGYTEHISVRRGWRRQGLATALLCQSLHAVKAAGMTEAALTVDTDNANHALQLYESCGFLVEHGTTAYRKPLIMESI